MIIRVVSVLCAVVSLTSPLLALAGDGASIELTMTLAEDTNGMPGDDCGPSDMLTVGEGAEVEVCYYMTNTGSVELNLHDVEDTELGVLLANFPATVGPGASAWFTITVTASSTTTYNGTWTAYNEGPVDVAESTDSATLTVVPASIELTMTLAEDTNGMPGDDCGPSDMLTVDAGAEVEVCYYMTNTGMTELTLHDVEDTELGVLLGPGFPAVVGPGVSAWFTITVTASSTTTYNGTWTAYNEGPINVATSMDSATLTVNLSETATFAVEKFFNDGNPAEVEVTITCNTGLPLQQPATISEGDGVVFVVGDFNDGEMNCTVTETESAGGYTVEYFDGTTTSDEGCSFEGVVLGGDYICEVTNTLLPVDIEVTKTWVDDNPQFETPLVAQASYVCENEQFGDSAGSLFFIGNPDSQTFSVFPSWEETTTCTVEEDFTEGGVETDDSECQSLSVSPGNGNACTIVNVRLYEGIPTLDRYGLAVLLLLVLGIGGFALRRLA